MATSSGGNDSAAAQFSLPSDESDDDDTQRQEELAENEEIRQKIISKLSDVFAKDMLIQTCEDDIHEEWIQKRPKIVFNYLFGNEIGNGSYGKVKEVLHFKTNVRRAVKIIKDKKVGKIPGGIANVQREFSILKQLDHPNIIRLIESFRVEAKSKLYLIFEFCVTSIDFLLDQSPVKRMNEYQANFYFTQLISGVDYLHSNGVIHKDIKPTNLLINEENTLKIGDFGVAEKLESPANDICTISQGTPAFQAPEVVMGDNPTFRGKGIDVWACGVTLYRMTVGVYPFDGSVMMKLFDNIIHEQITLPSDILLSEEIKELINGMLIKNPENRWTLKEIKEASWMTMVHTADPDNLIPLPIVDNAVFEEMLQLIEEDINGVDMVEEAIPFNGSYPPTVMDRTLQTPGYFRTSESQGGEQELAPVRLEFDHHEDGGISFNEAPTNSPLVISNAKQHEQQQPEPHRQHRRGIFSCFCASNNSPE